MIVKNTFLGEALEGVRGVKKASLVVKFSSHHYIKWVSCLIGLDEAKSRNCSVDIKSRELL